MIRLSTALWLALVACTGFGMFEVKYAVMDLEDQLARINRQVAADDDAIHILHAEWSYLSQPARIADLARRYLDLAPVGTAQLGQIDAIAMRPEPAPAIATASDVPVPQPKPRPPIAVPRPATPRAATTTVASAQTRIHP